MVKNSITILYKRLWLIAESSNDGKRVKLSRLLRKMCLSLLILFIGSNSWMATAAFSNSSKRSSLKFWVVHYLFHLWELHKDFLCTERNSSFAQRERGSALPPVRNPIISFQWCLWTSDWTSSSLLLFYLKDLHSIAPSQSSFCLSCLRWVR